MCNRKSCPIGGCTGWGSAWQVGVPGGWVCRHSTPSRTPSRWVCPVGGCACQVGVPNGWVCSVWSPPARGCAGWGATWHVGVPGGWVCPAGGCAGTPPHPGCPADGCAHQVGVPVRWVCPSDGCAHQMGVRRGSLALCLSAPRHLLWAWTLLPQASLRPPLGAAPGRPRASLSPPSLQTAACPTPASLELSAAASPTAPGPAAPARGASWATAPTARTWTRWVPFPRLRGSPRGLGPRLMSTLSVPQCAVVTDVCFATSKAHRCVNTNPGYHCLPCPPRYKGNQPFGVGLEAARTEKQVSRCLRGLRTIRWAGTERGGQHAEGPLTLRGAGPGGLSVRTASRGPR